MIFSLFFLNAATAFVTLFAFKIAVFVLAVSGAEGHTSALRTFAKLGLCLGWDVVGALLVSMMATLPLVALRRTVHAGVGRKLGAALQMAHGVFLLISFRVSQVVGSPIDKAALDLAFFSTDLTGPARGGQILGSILPYLSWDLFLQMFPATVGPLLFFLWLARPIIPPTKPMVFRMLIGAVALFVASAFVIPGLANGRAAIHTFGLERSPLPLLIASYLKDPFRSIFLSEPRPADPFCLDLRPPPEAGVDAAAANPLRAAVPARTNLVLIFLESVSVHAMATRSMPFVEQLGSAPDGVNFLRHYTHWPQTMKSVFSLLCSELPYPHYTPITYVNPAIPCHSLPEVLKAAGYRTGLFNSGDLAFDRQMLFLKHRQFDLLSDRNTMASAQTAWQNSWGVDEGMTVGATLSWIDGQKAQHRDAPFFALYNVASGHHPYEFPGHPMEKNPTVDQELAAQKRTLTYVDDRIRELVQGLAARGLRENTLIAIVSDHGPGSGRPGMGRVRDASVYEGSVHVPLVLNGPQLRGGGGSVTFLSSHQDLAPTLLGLLDIAPPLTMKGRNLLQNDAPRTVIIGTRPPLSQIGVLAGRWKLVHWQENGVSELFDLQADPAENQDLSPSNRGVVNALLAQGLAWQIHARQLIENYGQILHTHGRRCDPEAKMP